MGLYRYGPLDQKGEIHHETTTLVIAHRGYTCGLVCLEEDERLTMTGLINAVNQSVLTRFLANIFLFLVLVTALIVAVLQVTGHADVNLANINPMVLTVLGAGLGSSLQLLGLNVGVTLQPMVQAKAPTPTPTDAPPLTIVK